MEILGGNIPCFLYAMCASHQEVSQLVRQLLGQSLLRRLAVQASRAIPNDLEPELSLDQLGQSENATFSAMESIQASNPALAFMLALVKYWTKEDG